MASKKADQKFKNLTEELRNDPNVLAFYLAGSMGKGMITKYSDYDSVIIVKDAAKAKYEKKYVQDFNDPEFDTSVRTISELKKHAAFGSDMAWDRFNYYYLKVIFDKTGKVQKIIDKKTVISEKEAKQIISGNLDAFINQIYRSAKCRRDGNPIAAHLEAAESILYFLNSIFALEYRNRPYYKYLAWDLEHHPLKKLPWKNGELIKKIMTVIKTGDEKTFLELFNKTKPIFIKAGYKAIYDSWKGKYKVG